MRVLFIGDHADGHDDEDETDVSRLFDRMAKTDDRQGADQGERPGDIGADDQHDEGDHHSEHHERVHVGLRVRDAAVRGSVHPAHEQREHEAQGEHGRDVEQVEAGREVAEALEFLDELTHDTDSPCDPKRCGGA